jgi:hypothetical protein
MPEAAPADLPQGEALLAALRGLPVPEGAPTLFSVTVDDGVAAQVFELSTQEADDFTRIMLEGVDADLFAPAPVTDLVSSLADDEEYLE